MKWLTVLFTGLAIVGGSAIAYGQLHPTGKGKLGSSFTGGGAGASLTPGGATTALQFNTNGTFGGISGVTSDGANVGFTTSSNLILYGQTPSLCLTVDANSNVISQSCAAGSQTGIAAGSNITTSGTASNVTVNVVATPSFTTVIASGNVTAGSAQFTGAVSGTTAVFQTITDATLGGCLQGTAGVIGSTGVSCATQTSTPSIAAGTNITTSGTAANTTVNVVATPSFTTVIATGDLTAARAQFTGFLTASGANLQTATIGSLGATTQCLDSVAGVVTGFGAPCATQVSTPSIAAGTNITTSGTAANTTVNVVATPSFTSVIATGDLTAARAQFTGFLTASGSNLQTATIASLGATTQCVSSVAGVITGFGAPCATQTSTPSIAAGTNITTSGTAANTTINLVATPSVTTLIASGNLTAATAQFSGFLTAGGASLSGLTIVTATHTGNLTGTTANFSGNLTGTTAQFTGAVTGTSAQFQTYAGSTANLTGNLTGTTAQFSAQVTGTTAVFQTVTAQNFTTLAQGFVPASSNAAGAFLKGDATFGTPTTIALASSTTTTPQGWLNWAGQGRTTADTVGFTTTGFGNLITITGLVAGRTYKFEAEIPVKAAVAATGGIAIRIGGGATATAVVYDGYIVDFGSTGGVSNGTKGSAQATALSSSVANATLSGTTGHITVVGTITVNAGGSLILQGGGFTTVTAASAVTAERGTTFLIYDIP